MTAVRAVVFDYAHTLVDFRRVEEALRTAYGQMRARVEAVASIEVPELLDLVERVTEGADRLVAACYEERRLEEVDAPVLFRDSFSPIGFDLPRDAIDHIVALERLAYETSLRPDQGVLRALAGLREGGYRMGLVSNIARRPDLVARDLEGLGLSAYLDATVFSREVGHREPDARIFREALGRLGARPGETVFVGGRLRHISGALAVGLRSVLTRQFRREERGEAAAHAVVEDLRELPGLLERWSEGARSPRVRGSRRAGSPEPPS